MRKPGGAADEPLAMGVERVEVEEVAEIVTSDRALFEYSDLPSVLSAAAGTT